MRCERDAPILQYLEIVIESHWECGDRPTPGSLGIVMEMEYHSFVGRDRWFSPKYMTEQPPPYLQYFQRNWGLFTIFVEGLICNFCRVSNSQNPAQLLSMVRVQLF